MTLSKIENTGVDADKLRSWEAALDDVNATCYVPGSTLQAAFDEKTRNSLVSRPTNNKNNISYLTSTSPFAIRYLNDAFIWANLFERLKFDGNLVTELGPGTSRVIDIALAFVGFDGELTKIDYTEWKEPKDGVSLRHKFTIKPLALDVVKEAEILPKSGLLVMNHFLDDLFMGLWAKASDVDYFGHAINKIEENSKCWEAAIDMYDELVPTIFDFIENICKTIDPGNYIIIKNYPSGFETHFRQVRRVNFTRMLAEDVSEKISRNGFKRIDINQNEINGPEGSKYPGAFFVFYRPVDHSL